MSVLHMDCHLTGKKKNSNRFFQSPRKKKRRGSKLFLLLYEKALEETEGWNEDFRESVDQRKVCLLMFYKGQESGKAKRASGTKSTLQIQSNPHKNSNDFLCRNRRKYHKICMEAKKKDIYIEPKQF